MFEIYQKMCSGCNLDVVCSDNGSVVGTRLYFRTSFSLRCFALSKQSAVYLLFFI